MALDLAKISGVCYGAPLSSPCFETWDLDGATRGHRGFIFMSRLSRLLKRLGRNGEIFIEEPLSSAVEYSIGTKLETAIQLKGLVMIAEVVAYSQGIPVSFVQRQSALMHFTGRAKYPNRDDGKRACVARAKSLGWKINGFDEADAAALWDCAQARKFPREWSKHAMKRPFMGR